MLHEAYAPVDAASVAWSRQKKNTFMRIISDTREGKRQPSVLLLYGPPGCGKLSSVVAMLPGLRETDGAAMRVKVQHTCEASPQEYYQFLMDIFSYQKGEATARVVKFYGESLRSNIHALTVRFLDHYDAVRRDLDSAGGLQHYERNLLRHRVVIFIITTHDTHSDKVFLNKSLPARVLSHPVVELFYCTPLTTRSMTSRIRQILQMEEESQREKKKGTTLCIIPDEELEMLCEHCHGDIRHALLQVQWRLLGSRNEMTKPVTRRAVRTKRQRSVLDLVDDGEAIVADGGYVAPSRQEEAQQHLSSSQLKTLEAVAGDVTFRDEYLDVSHATARILTQKYTTLAVGEELNVEPDRLVGYLANNMHHYFRPSQMNEYAACATAASASDALRSTGGSFGRWRRNGATPHSRLTSDDDNDGVGNIGLDLMALLLFGKAYVVYHKEVFIPRALVAQRPPPFIPCAFPRLRDVAPPLQRRPRWNGNTYHDDYDAGRNYGEEEKVHKQVLTLFSSELEWRRDFERRLGLSSPAGMEVDILRETLPALVNRCGSLESILLEYAPYAQWIVLDRPNTETTKVTSAVAPLTTNPFSGVGNSSMTTLRRQQQQSAPPLATLSGPRKTLFTLSSPVVQQKRQSRRPCSRLRYRLLCRGVRGDPPVRGDEFTLVSSDEDDVGNDLCTRQPLIPDGEDIEEFSD